MATQKPLVLINGVLQQLPAGDVIPATSVGLGNVENTALSTWGGSANITTVGTLNGLTFSGSLYRVGGTSIAYWLQQDGTGRSHWYWGTSGGTAPTFATAGEDAGNIRISVSNAGAGANFTFRSASGLGKAAGDAIAWTDVITADLVNFLYKGNTVWRADNDGAGSGLDADLLDGQQGSFYQNASNLNAGTVPAARLPAVTWTDQGAMSAADKQKLDGMATGQPGSATWFTSSGTWTRPSLSLFTFAVVELWGAGGGGGGGQRYYNADRRMGGTGGGGGAYRRMQFLLADLPSSVTVTIGAGGTGGAGSASLGATPGNGQDGGATTFGSILQAYGGKGGPALVAASTITQIGGRGAGVTQPDTANEAIAWGTGGNGGQQTPGGNANDVGAPSGAAGAGGGAGGGLSAANVAITGKNGGANSAAKTGGTGATTQGAAGGNGALFGEGGGGGGWGLTANAGNGGNGNVAGGGGGGGASTDTYLPGNGGNGGPGRCVVYVW